jgi:hypothetical protein
MCRTYGVIIAWKIEKETLSLVRLHTFRPEKFPRGKTKNHFQRRDAKQYNERTITNSLRFNPLAYYLFNCT